MSIKLTQGPEKWPKSLTKLRESVKNWKSSYRSQNRILSLLGIFACFRPSVFGGRWKSKWETNGSSNWQINGCAISSSCLTHTIFYVLLFRVEDNVVGGGWHLLTWILMAYDQAMYRCENKNWYKSPKIQLDCRVGVIDPMWGQQVKMTGYWPSSFFAFYGLRFPFAPWKRKNRMKAISSHLDLTSLVNKGFIIKLKVSALLRTKIDLFNLRAGKESQLYL